MIALVRVPDDLAGAAPNPRPSQPHLPGAAPRANTPADLSPPRVGDVRVAESDPVRTALEHPRLTVTRMAAELGIPRATLEAYRLGTRRMPAATRARLAEYLEQHARALQELAAILHRS